MRRWLKMTQTEHHMWKRGIGYALNRWVLIFTKLLIHWNFLKMQTSPGFTENVSQKRDVTVEFQRCVLKLIASVGAKNDDSQICLSVLLFFSSSGLFHLQQIEEQLTHLPEAHSVSSKQSFYSYSNAFSHTCALLLPSNFSFEAQQPCVKLFRELRDPHPRTGSLWRDIHTLSDICCLCYTAVCACARACARHSSDTKKREHLLIWWTPLGRSKGSVLHSARLMHSCLFLSHIKVLMICLSVW